MAYHRFWINFEKINKPTPLNLGCGVTASDQEEAINLVQMYIFGNATIPKITHVVQDVELNALDQHHVIPNIGDINVRGIWFPQGYGDEMD